LELLSAVASTWCISRLLCGDNVFATYRSGTLVVYNYCVGKIGSTGLFPTTFFISESYYLLTCLPVSIEALTLEHFFFHFDLFTLQLSFFASIINMSSPGSTRVLRFERSDENEAFVLIQVSHTGPAPLDLTLTATEGESPYVSLGGSS